MTIRKRLVLGLRWGLSLSAVYCVVVLLVWAVRGSEAFVGVGAPPWAVLLSYLLAGILAGSVFGILSPLGESWWGAAFLGFVLAFVVFLPVVGLSSRTLSFRQGLSDALQLAGIIGPITALLYKKLVVPIGD